MIKKDARLSVASTTASWLLGMIVVAVYLTAGCQKNPQPTETPSESAARNTNSASPNTSPPTQRANPAEQDPSPSTPSQRTPPIEQLPVVKLLERDDLNPAVKQVLLVHQAQGKASLTESEFKDLQIKHDLAFAIDALAADPLLTKSNTLIETAEVVYSDQPTNSLEYLKGLIQYRLTGWEHFQGREIKGISDDIKKQAADLIKQAIELPLQPYSPEDRKALNRALYDLKQRHPTLVTDPMYLLAYGLTFSALGSASEAAHWYRLSEQVFRHADYPSRIAILSSMYLNEQRANVPEGTITKADLARFYLGIEHWLIRDFQESPDQHRYVNEVLNNFIGSLESQADSDSMERFQAMLANQLHLPPWVRSMARANLHHRMAWHIRGTDVSRNIPIERMVKFQDYEALAIEYFLDAHRINPMFPESACGLLSIKGATDFGDESEEYWFKKALEAHYDHEQAYLTRMTFLRPQWGGSIGQMIAFGDQCLAEKRFDTIVPHFLVDCYADILTKASARAEARDQVRQDPELAKRMIEALDGLIADPTPKVRNQAVCDVSYFLTEKAAIALNAELSEIACEAFEQMNGRYHRGALTGLWNSRSTFEMFQASAYTDLPEAKAESEQIDGLFHTRHVQPENRETVIELCKKWEQNHPDNKGLILVQAIQRACERELEFLDGKQIELDFDPAFSLWQLDPDQVTYESPNTVSISNLNSSFAFRFDSILRLQGNRVMEYEIHYPLRNKKHITGNHLTPSLDAIHYSGAAFSFGMNQLYLPIQAGNSTSFGQLSFGYTASDQPMMMFKIPTHEGVNRFRYHLSTGYYEVYFNDQFVFRSSEKKILNPLPVISFVQPASRRGRGQFKLSNIRVKKLPDENPPVREDAESLIKYYQAEVEREPENRWPRFWLAQSIHKSGELQRAITEYQTVIQMGLPEPTVAFYLADCFERLGDWDAALKWYRISADEKTADLTTIFPRRQNDMYGNSNQWASYRLRWLALTGPNDSIRKQAADGAFTTPIPPDRLLWTLDLLKAQTEAAAGRFPQAEQLAKKVLPRCPVAAEDLVLNMIETFKSGKPFHHAANTAMIYQDVDDPIPFFQNFEDLLDMWNNTY